MKEIKSLEDIKILVDTFYSNVRENELLGPIFNERIGNNWPTHLEKMYKFWQTILLHENTYSGNPFAPHASMPIDEKHFQQWFQLFEKTVNSLFEGELAQEAIHRAKTMVHIFQTKKAYLDKLES